MFRAVFLLSISILAVISQACKDNTENPAPELLGNWRLTEVYFDPGDGSGTFQATDDDKLLSFFDDGTVTTSASFCALGEGVPDVAIATYDPEQMTIDPDCGSTNGIRLRYEFSGDELIVSYPCFEPCLEKYHKVLLRDR